MLFYFWGGQEKLILAIFDRFGLFWAFVALLAYSILFSGALSASKNMGPDLQRGEPPPQNNYWGGQSGLFY